MRFIGTGKLVFMHSLCLSLALAAASCSGGGGSDDDSSSRDSSDTGGAGPDGGDSDNYFEGGCYDITDANVDDSCFDEAAEIPSTLLLVINNVLDSLGREELENPVNVSASVEQGMETFLVDLFPPYTLSPIDMNDYLEGSVTMEIPNPLAYELDENGNVVSSGTFTVTCTVSGDTLSCRAQDVYLNVTDILLYFLAGYPISASTWECWVNMGFSVDFDYSQQPEPILWAGGYDITVDQDNCNDVIEILLNDPGQTCGMDVEASLTKVDDGDCTL